MYINPIKILFSVISLLGAFGGGYYFGYKACDQDTITRTVTKTDTVVKTVYIRDTIHTKSLQPLSEVDTVVKLANKNNDTVFVNDKVREYTLTKDTAGVTINNKLKLRGELLDYSLDYSIEKRVETITKEVNTTIRKSSNKSIGLYAGMSTDVPLSAPGLQASVKYRKFLIGYGFNPFNNGHEISLQYRIIGN